MLIVNCDVVVNVEGRVEAKDVEEAKALLRNRLDKVFTSESFELAMHCLNKNDNDDLGFFYTIETIEVKEEA